MNTQWPPRFCHPDKNFDKAHGERKSTSGDRASQFGAGEWRDLARARACRTQSNLTEHRMRACRARLITSCSLFAPPRHTSVDRRLVMSSSGPDHVDKDDADKALKQAVPWVSDPASRDDDTHRLQEDVIAAARRLEQESSQPKPPSTAVGLRPAIPREDKAGGEERARRIWAQLKPEYMPPPPRRLGGPPMAVVAGVLLGVAAFATI